MTRGRRRVRGAVLAALLALAAADLPGFLSGAEHHGGFWNSVPLGDLALGTLAAGGLAWFARRVLKRLLSRPESYYSGGRGA